ncbi:N-acetylglucosamine-6-phosphate deacetylase [Butyrivibrio sp. XPD2002]|uniref:N-acetylglucosamine-6-phosphate deacetylase n=1 Tax=Butyrivibrio sp. XPD2002 TaxID=1280665 RepID=UPI000420B4AA|nr:N-acetylglucosamine-6-phosphate deacetylase [Butyrivibrio sp. XPD2002]
MKITGAKVFTENHIFTEKDICVQDGRIADSSADSETFDGTGLMAIPGLVDIHFHGAVGHDFCDGDAEGLKEIAEYEAKSGILAICPATMTMSEETLSKAVTVAKEYAQKNSEHDDKADLVGINMEGPFISPDKVGAQNPEFLKLPDAEMFKRLMKDSGDLIKLVDIAPELSGSMEFIKTLSDEVNISIAHTCTDYETAIEAFDAGARHLTHLFNAMPGLNHRLPGPIAAGIEKSAEAELIADGIHVHPAMVRFAFNAFLQDKMILISDSMEATGLPDGEYQLGGQKVTVCGNKATLTEKPDVIAGSVTNLFNCMKNAVQNMGIPVERAVRAATENPAKAIGIDADYGSLKEGCYANILLVDDELNIKYVFKKGKLLK